MGYKLAVVVKCSNKIYSIWPKFIKLLSLLNMILIISKLSLIPIGSGIFDLEGSRQS